MSARDVAETGSREALESLAVREGNPYEHMTEGQRALRRRLRVHTRKLGDRGVDLPERSSLETYQSGGFRYQIEAERAGLGTEAAL